MLPISEARRRKAPFQLTQADITKPSFLGLKNVEMPLEQIREYIDWTPFFHAWELRGSYPKIFSDPVVGVEAKKLFDEGQQLLDQIIAEKWLTARAVVGFWPANSVGDDIELYTDESRTKVLTVIHTLRQQAEKESVLPNYALADFIAPKDSGVKDYLGGFAVTAGIGTDAIVEHFRKQHDDYNAILAKALADRCAEAFAELLHQIVRKQFWGYAKDEMLENAALIDEKYQGIRPAPGYPACPDHTEKRALFDLLDAEKNAGIELTENFAMFPTAAVSGFYLANPGSKYFNVGKIGRDQVEDYAQRKGMDLATVERWLSPNLNYDI